MIVYQAGLCDYVGTLTAKADESANIVRPEAKHIITKLAQHYRLGVISKTKNPDARIHELQALPFACYFQHIQTCREKNEEVVAAALKGLQVGGIECWVVDDRIRNFPPFRKAGCTTIWLRDGVYATEEPENEYEQPQHIITSLAGLLPLLLPSRRDQYKAL
ncbi:HAD family hydrolase [Candidatus Pacearchaeota archaeon]|nr:HAD family hydrolase [Candidatus Pacearchaeota archaeon]